MEKRDNLEKFIKEQIESIEATGSDRMWEQFQHSYEITKPNYRPLFGVIALIIVALSGYWLFDNYKLVPIDKSTESTSIEQTSKRNEANILQEESTIVSKNNDNQESINFNQQDEIKPSDVQQQNSSIATSVSKEKLINQVANQANVSNAQINRQLSDEKRVLASTTNEESVKNIPLVDNKEINKPTVINEEKLIITSSKQEAIAESKKQSISVELNATVEGENATRIDVRKLNLLNTAPYRYDAMILPMAEFFNKDDFLRKLYRGNWFVDYQALISTNTVRQQHLGIGKELLSQKTPHTIEIMGGIQYSDGYSISLDSVKVVRSISITEYRKDKDLNILIDGYVAGLYGYNFDRFQVSVGGKFNYGIFNQYDIVEYNRVLHNENFNFGNGVTTETTQNNDWNPLNRSRFYGMMRLSYRWEHWALGLTASKQLNTLIKENLAAQNKSNNEWQFGLNWRYNF